MSCIPDARRVSIPTTATTLQWDAVGGADSYWLSIGTAPGASDVVDADLNSAATSTSVVLAPGSYYYRVYPMTSGVQGDPLDEVFFLVP